MYLIRIVFLQLAMDLDEPSSSTAYRASSGVRPRSRLRRRRLLT